MIYFCLSSPSSIHLYPSQEIRGERKKKKKIQTSLFRNLVIIIMYLMIRNSRNHSIILPGINKGFDYVVEVSTLEDIIYIYILYE